jgi:hypothetical protein
VGKKGLEKWLKWLSACLAENVGMPYIQAPVPPKNLKINEQISLSL